MAGSVARPVGKTGLALETVQNRAVETCPQRASARVGGASLFTSSAAGRLRSTGVHQGVGRPSASRRPLLTSQRCSLPVLRLREHRTGPGPTPNATPMLSARSPSSTPLDRPPAEKPVDSWRYATARSPERTSSLPPRKVANSFSAHSRNNHRRLEDARSNSVGMEAECGILSTEAAWYGVELCAPSATFELDTTAVLFQHFDLLGIDDPHFMLPSEEGRHVDVAQGSLGDDMVGTELAVCYPTRQGEALVRSVPERLRESGAVDVQAMGTCEVVAHPALISDVARLAALGAAVDRVE